MTLNEAYRSLGLRRDATAAQAKVAYRSRIGAAHPDHGGDTADFIRIRAAYEIISAFLHQPAPDDEAPVPADLRSVIDGVVGEFREHQRWAEAETLRRMEVFETRMSTYIQTASRSELRQFSTTFRNSWDAVIWTLFEQCNHRCDAIVKDYESWYAASTQAVLDDMYRRELLRFARRRRFWEAFVVLGALAGGLSVVVGWDGPMHRWVSLAMILVALTIAFLVHYRSAGRERRNREKVEPLSVAPFALEGGACFRTESVLRRGRRQTGAMSIAGMLLGNAASAGFAAPVLGAVAGAALGGAFDRLLNPTDHMREGMQLELRRFMTAIGPQVTTYVLEAHERLLSDIRVQIVDNYQERVKGTVKLLAGASGR